MKQLDLFEWARLHCFVCLDYCDSIVCAKCKQAQLSDFNFVNNFIGEFEDEH